MRTTRRRFTVSLLATATLLSGCGSDEPTRSGIWGALRCDDIQQLTIGESVSGTISASDCPRLDGPASADYYELTLPADSPVSISVQASSGFLVVVLMNTSYRTISLDNAMPGSPGIAGGDLAAGRYMLMIAAGEQNRTAAYSFTSSRTLPPE